MAKDRRKQGAGNDPGRLGVRDTLSNCLRYDVPNEDGWTVFSSDDQDDGQDPGAAPDLSVLRKIKDFLSGSAGSALADSEDLDAPVSPARVAYPYYESGAEPSESAFSQELELTSDQVVLRTPATRTRKSRKTERQVVAPEAPKLAEEPDLAEAPCDAPLIAVDSRPQNENAAPVPETELVADPVPEPIPETPAPEPVDALPEPPLPQFDAETDATALEENVGISATEGNESDLNLGVGDEQTSEEPAPEPPAQEVREPVQSAPAEPRAPFVLDAADEFEFEFKTFAEPEELPVVAVAPRAKRRNDAPTPDVAPDVPETTPLPFDDYSPEYALAPPAEPEPALEPLAAPEPVATPVRQSVPTPKQNASRAATSAPAPEQRGRSGRSRMTILRRFIDVATRRQERCEETAVESNVKTERVDAPAFDPYATVELAVAPPIAAIGEYCTEPTVVGTFEASCR